MTKKGILQSQPQKGVFNVSHVYYEHVLQLRREYPDAYTKSHVHRKARKYSVLRMEEGKAIVLADWEKFKAISNLLFWLVGEALIAGYRIHMSKIGYLYPKKIEANPDNPMINWQASLRYQEENNLPCTRQHMLFYSVDEYCRIDWQKSKLCQGLSVYELNMSSCTRYKTGLKDRCSQAWTNDPMVQSRYAYFKREKDVV